MERITSRKNPLLEHMRRLDGAAYRRERGEFLCDSPKLVEEALRHGAQVLAVAVSDGMAPPQELAPDVRCVAVPQDVMASISPVRTPQGMLAVCRTPDTALPEKLTGRRYVVLDGVQDPGNVGTVIRTADAFGCDGVVLLAGCADPFSVKTLRSSMGAAFRLPVWCSDAAALRSNPAIGNGVLDGNPLHEDMCEAAALVKDLFMINLVMNAQMKLAGIYSGHYLTSWQAGCRAVDAIYKVPVPEKADVIVAGCGGYPKDISLYQGTKAIDNVESGLRPGGTLILVIEAPEGGGPEEYFGWSADLTAGTIEKRLREAFTVAGYVFFLNCEQARRYNILLYSSIDPESVAPMGIRAFSDVDALLAAAQLDGKSVYVIPNASTVIPCVTEEKGEEK